MCPEHVKRGFQLPDARKSVQDPRLCALLLVSKFISMLTNLLISYLFLFIIIRFINKNAKVLFGPAVHIFIYLLGSINFLNTTISLWSLCLCSSFTKKIKRRSLFPHHRSMKHSFAAHCFFFFIDTGLVQSYL